jgi:RNA polymerase sigma factor (sigma-70 family)
MDLYNLIRDSQLGDTNSTSNLYLDFSNTIKKLSKNIDYEEAETDLIISFLDLIKEIDIDSFKDKDNKQLAKFIHTYLRNKAVDLFRKYVMKKKIVIGINYDLLCDNSHVDFDNNIFISSLLDSLPEKQRKIIILKYIYGFSNIEIAKLLKVSRQAINNVKNRALKNLKSIASVEGGEIVGRKDNRISL